jgi:hypothetical protein
MGFIISGQATSVVTTPEVAGDSNAPNTTLLLSGDGTNNATNNTFVDSSSNNFAITRVGNTTQGSFSPYGANWSNYFDGSSAIVNRSNNTALAMGTGDFTIEFWMNAPSTSSVIVLYDSRLTTSVGTGGINIYHQSGTLYLYGGASTNVLLVSASITYNQWNHIAFVKSGSSAGNVKMYVNGVLSSTYGSADTSNYSLGYMAIGAFYNPSLDYFYTGYLSNFRIVKGTAVYTGNFTPSTTPLTAIANTSLLTCQSNRFIDNSTNAFTITKNGDTRVQRFSPFSPTAAYSAGTIGGSGYFDGNGDYLSMSSSSSPVASQDFTIECWYYPVTRATVYGTIYGNFLTYSASGIAIWDRHDFWPTKINVQCGGVNATSTTSIVNNIWYHIAVTRASGTLKLYINGVLEATTASANSSNTPDASFIGRGDNASLAFTYINAYVSDFRIVKGTAVYTGTFTPPTAPLTAISGTQFLANMTNAGIVDSAMMNNLEAVGDAKISTTQSKFGGSSMYFDGTGDYLTTPTTTNLSFGAGDFTVEAWVYLTANPANANGAYLTDFRANGSTSNFAIGFIGSGAVTKMYAWANAADITGSATVTLNTWNHVAYVRSGTTVTAYLNGTANGTMSSSYSQPSTGVAIGSRYTGSEYITGYVDDLRVTKGLARYTANFTPPTAALSAAGTIPGTSTTTNISSGITMGGTGTGMVISSYVAPVMMDYLIVAGGGGGGGWGGAGGGAGGAVTGSTTYVSGTTYSITVGGGGDGGGNFANGTSGGNSSVTGLTTAVGGGAGAGAFGTAVSGGSGGGASLPSAPSGASGTSGQGFAGGSSGGTTYAGAGGGGAGGVGANSVSVNAGMGGLGIISTISGSSVTYAGGGGGGSAAGGASAGGGGGAGNANSPGTANTGGGGCGGGQAPGSAGGSGIVILRTPDSVAAASSTTGSPTVTVAGGYRVYKWTTVGSGSITF